MAIAADLPFSVDPADEGRHPPGTELLWSESYYFDFVDASGDLAGYVRLGYYPNWGVSWWTTMVVGPGRPLVESVAYDWPVEPDPASVRLAASEPLQQFSVTADAPASVEGQQVGLRMDLTWRTDGLPYHYGLTTRYEIPCLVEGELSIGDERLEVRGQGQRDHSWGVRDWWAIAWCWSSARLDDGTRYHGTDVRFPGGSTAFGYVQPPGGPLTVLEKVGVTEELGAGGLPTRARIETEPGGLSLDVEPLLFAPLLLTAPDGRTSKFPRALAHYTAADGRRGEGWIEWNQPQP